IVKGTDRREQAERLVDYLLSREVELRLARSESRQVPLGDVGEELPEEFAAFPLRKDYPLRGRGERHNFPVITRSES
ncbi:MAG TPA: hypothetical protein VF170_18105, partial [Planctomycetaceae bacterium]